MKSSLEAVPAVSASQWVSSDLDPEAVLFNQVPEIPLLKMDSLRSPLSADVIVTNPPYLAKNSAKRMGIEQKFGEFTDLWEKSIDMCLNSADYVAAIIPESFITRKLFKDRLFGVVSITDLLFDDTDFPVCLALWVPEGTGDFVVRLNDEIVGNYSSIVDGTDLLSVRSEPKVRVKFNVPEGVLGVKAVDNTSGNSIYRLCSRGHH